MCSISHPPRNQRCFKNYPLILLPFLTKGVSLVSAKMQCRAATAYSCDVRLGGSNMKRYIITMLVYYYYYHVKLSHFFLFLLPLLYHYFYLIFMPSLFLASLCFVTMSYSNIYFFNLLNN